MIKPVSFLLGTTLLAAAALAPPARADWTEDRIPVVHSLYGAMTSASVDARNIGDTTQYKADGGAHSGGSYASASNTYSAAAAGTSLADGILRSRSIAGQTAPNMMGDWCGAYGDGCPHESASAVAQFWDTVSFQNPDMHPEENIPLDIKIDGMMNSAGKAFLDYYIGDIPDINRVTPWPTTRVELKDGTTDVFDTFTSVFYSAMLPGSTYFIYLSIETEAFSTDKFSGSADFGHTVHFNWDLPPGVTYTSASGTFMSNASGPVATPDPVATPEPGSLAVLGAGLAFAGLLCRRERRDGGR